MPAIKSFKAFPLGLQIIIGWFFISPAFLYLFLKGSYIPDILDFIFVGVVLILSWGTAYFLIKQKSWIRKMIVILSGIGFFFSVTIFLIDVLLFSAWSDASNIIASLTQVILPVTFNGFIIWYLSRFEIRKMFWNHALDDMSTTERHILDKWNWGAFLMGWIWGLGNHVYISLLSFVPVLNIIMPFVLGIKGNEWAWKKKKWKDIEHFKRIQKRWTIAGVIILLIKILAVVGFFVYFGGDYYKHSSIAGSPYQIEGDAVYYGVYNKDQVHGADVSTFQILNEKYAKDATFAYFGDQRIEGADMESFVALDVFYAKDRNQVYNFGEPVYAYDPPSFKVLSGLYTKDNMYVYYSDAKIPDADPSSFTIFENEAYTKDSNYVYYLGDKVSGADIKSFKIYYGNNYDAMDDMFAYSYGKRYLPGLDMDTVKFVGQGFYTDKSGVWVKTDDQWNMRLLEDADPDSFMVLNDRIFTDGNHMWQYLENTRILSDMDKVLDPPIKVFSRGKIVVFKDTSVVHIYYNGELYDIKGADLESFTRAFDEVDTIYKDKIFVYGLLYDNDSIEFGFQPIPINNADPSTIELAQEIPDGLLNIMPKLRDKNATYIFNKQTFEYQQAE